MISKTFYRKEQHIYGFMYTPKKVYKRFKHHLHKINLGLKSLCYTPISPPQPHDGPDELLFKCSQ